MWQTRQLKQKYRETVLSTETADVVENTKKINRNQTERRISKLCTDYTKQMFRQSIKKKSQNDL